MATLRRRYSHPEPNPKPNPEPNPNPSPNPNPNPYANHDDPAEAMTGRLAWVRDRCRRMRRPVALEALG